MTWSHEALRSSYLIFAISPDAESEQSRPRDFHKILSSHFENYLPFLRSSGGKCVVGSSTNWTLGMYILFQRPET